MLPASTASGAPARAEGAPVAAQDSRAAGAAAQEPVPAQAPALELAPAPGIVSAPQTAFIPAEMANNAAPALMAEATGSDGMASGLRASLARMMAAEHRWPAPALATSYAEQSANLAGAPLSLEKICPSRAPLSLSPNLLPARFAKLFMEVAVCASGDGCDARTALCASPALSQVPAAAPLPAAFLPPAMTLAELTALATGDPDALKAFVDGQQSVAAGALPTAWGHASCDALRKLHVARPGLRLLRCVCTRAARP